MKIEITLKNYNKLKAKEAILNQITSIIELDKPNAEFNSVIAAYKKIKNVLTSIDDIITTEFSDFLDMKISMNRKIYDFYLDVQNKFSQIENLECSNTNSTESLVLYWNTIAVFIRTYKDTLKKQKNDIEEFNTLVKIERENRILKKRNVEMEDELKNLKDKDVF